MILNAKFAEEKGKTIDDYRLLDLAIRHLNQGGFLNYNLEHEKEVEFLDVIVSGSYVNSVIITPVSVNILPSGLTVANRSNNFFKNSGMLESQIESFNPLSDGISFRLSNVASRNRSGTYTLKYSPEKKE